MPEYHLLIDGRLVPGGATMDVVDPATGAVLAVAPRADAAQLEQAVQAAKAAFPAWAALGYPERRAALIAIADALQPRQEEFARLLTAEQGKPLAQAMGEMAGTIAMLRILGGLDVQPKILRDDGARKIVEHRTPLGVVAAITPWNFPMILLAVKLAPALLAGNTVVAKPAPTTPLTSLLLAELCSDHLPPGVLNVITDDNDLGALLGSHPDVAKVSFTGSTATGRQVMAGAASTLKRLTLELGGNDAAIVLDDADIAEVAPKVFAAAMMNAGQLCLATKRVYVHDSQYDAMCDALAALADAAVVAEGTSQGAQLGPVQNRAQYEKIRALIEDSRRVGTIVAGGQPHEGPGYFIRPTIVRDIADDARLVREEQFGPVLPILRYGTLDEAIARVNDSDHGLGGTVWTSDPERGLDVAMRVDSGVLWVNAHMASDPLIAIGGAKQSGIGVELGLEGLEEYTQRHVVYVTRA